ncbi:SNF2-related protein [Leptolyngbya subtilissima ST-M1]|uniref:SNF2-related protein n=1 Tax=Cyanophyceae TaxID=3028117 RepID=UPI001F5595FA|nr:SNF2-related protein [Nodosilinea sp. FACHB-131]
MMVQIEFSSSERTYYPKSLLEPCGNQNENDFQSLICQGRFGGPEDLRRILTLEKIKGQLTNVFYSMETSQTEFYAHQFKPILKFLNSSQGRLLIADEVGLGKTIESMYIWKELQVREEARRLLIICPAMLRQKWQDDLHQRFNIQADIVDTKSLLARLERGVSQPFVYIISLEGTRQGLGGGSDWDNPENNSPNFQLARLLDQNPASETLGLFDLVIVDEAHYLRNPTTASHRLGRLLRDASRHFVLLTATPIQTKSQDLFNLLRLVDQDTFYNEFVYNALSEANRPIFRAIRHLWTTPTNISAAQQEVATALQSHYFSDNSILHDIHKCLSSELLEDSARIELGYKLEKISLLGQYISRSRKTDVLPNRVIRKARTLGVEFSDLEWDFYQTVSQQIRRQCRGKKGAALFKLITRQRQMASCMVAAFRGWRKSGVLEELANVDEECLWEDLGIGIADWNDADDAINTPVDLNLTDDDLEELARNDSKYKELIKFLREVRQEDPSAKFVIFAYFRGTLHYLLERLLQDGIESCAIMGGMGDAKWDTVNRFRDPNGPLVLLSSEVGSEGIDLQHCRYIINYDLPWNPMRVEQRIGRLDRLGQQANSIVIANFSLRGTVEERILKRLYERIDIFRQSIGELEEILGPMTEKLLVDFFQQELTQQEMDKRIQQTIDAILNQRKIHDDLTDNAVNFLAFSDHIIQSIQDSKDKGRWLQPQELETFVADYFQRYYPGTTIHRRSQGENLFDIALSSEARIEFKTFLHGNQSATPTRLQSHQVTCFFDPKLSSAMGRGYELLEPTHSLIRWIRHRYESEQDKFYPVSALRLEATQAQLPPGLYTFVAQRWVFTGLKTESRIAYRLARYSDSEVFSETVSERVVMQAVQKGQPQVNVGNLIEDLNQVVINLQACKAALEEAFWREADDFATDNTNRCDVQLQSAESFAARKTQDLEERIERLRTTADPSGLRIIPALEGQLRRVRENFEVQRQLIDQRRSTSFQPNALAQGVIFLI